MLVLNVNRIEYAKHTQATNGSSFSLNHYAQKDWEKVYSLQKYNKT